MSRTIKGEVAIVGAAETTELGRIPHMSQIQLHADAARNAIADCGIDKSEIDGVACAGQSPVAVSHYLGITPTWLDGTSVGGCSFLLHVRHAAAAIAAGMCEVVLVTHGESGKSRVGAGGWGMDRSSLNGQFEMPYGPTGAPTMFTIGVLRYMHETGLTHEQLANVAVVQRTWATQNPRAMMQDPITVDDVFDSKMIAYPFHLFECCLVTDGGGALIITSAERAAAMDLAKPPVWVAGTGESCETPMVSQMEDFTTSKAFRVSGAKAFAEAGISHDEVDHLMIYDAFAHLPIYGLEDLGFVGRGEAGAFIAEGNTLPGGKLPLNTNGGGLSYTHTGMYGMFAIQESVRQVRGTAPAQVPDVNVSVAHGVGGMFAAAGTLVFSKERPS
ncbi:MAG: thiolase C-terminal domain-containing protein [Acidimicrobiales bacterium]